MTTFGERIKFCVHSFNISENFGICNLPKWCSENLRTSFLGYGVGPHGGDKTFPKLFKIFISLKWCLEGHRTLLGGWGRPPLGCGGGGGLQNL